MAVPEARPPIKQCKRWAKLELRVRSIHEPPVQLRFPRCLSAPLLQNLLPDRFSVPHAPQIGYSMPLGTAVAQ
jgi:hypothetical protein